MGIIILFVQIIVIYYVIMFTVGILIALFHRTPTTAELQAILDVAVEEARQERLNKTID